MSEKWQNVLNFLFSFIITLGSFVFALRVGGIIGVALDVLLCGVVYFVLKERNRSFARGTAWGIGVLIVFLFTLGGCAIFLLR